MQQKEALVHHQQAGTSQKPKVYRAMYERDGFPVTGSEVFQLGVCLPPDPNADINPDGDYVNPGSGGMSVFAALKNYRAG